MNRSSSRWLREHRRDRYVKSARDAGWRSRAAYKLLQLDKRDRLIRPGMRVLDLGAAPGGWSQVAAAAVGSSGRVIAVDILAMEPITNVVCVQGDFNESRVFEEVKATCGKGGFDLVLSDMAPNISGMKDVDQARTMRLADSAFAICEETLKVGGDFVVKVFQGGDLDNYVQALRHRFTRVVLRKPAASRDRSSEIYALARAYGV